MVHLSTALLFTAFSAFVAAQGTGTQFITGACTSDANCASGCCGFKSGKCAGAIVALERDGGCGFGSGTPNDNAARKLGFTGVFNPAAGTGGAAAAAPAAAGNANANMNANGNAATGNAAAGAASNGAGSQFITGVCQSDADCASACCGFKSGKCAGPVIAQGMYRHRGDEVNTRLTDLTRT